MPSALNPPLIGASQHKIIWSGLYGSASALAIASYAAKSGKPCFVVCANAREAESMLESLRFFVSSAAQFPLTIFPSWECLPYDDFSPHADIASMRIELLHQLPTLARSIVVIAIDNLMQRVPPQDYIVGSAFNLKVGELLKFAQFQQRLVNASYYQTQQVESPGEFAVRGGIVDVFPVGSDLPVRIELFDDAIDTLRYFDVVTQRSIRKIKSLRMLPGSEIRTDEIGVARFRQGMRKYIDGDPRENEVYRDIGVAQKPEGSEFYLPLFFDNTSSIFDYLPEDAVIFATERIEDGANDFWNQVQSRYKAATENHLRFPLPPELLYLDAQELGEQINGRAMVHLNTNDQHADCVFDSVPPLDAAIEPASQNPYQALLGHLANGVIKTLIAIDSLAHLNAVENQLSRSRIAFKRVDSWQEYTEDESSGIFTVNADMVCGLNLPSEQISAISNNEIHGRRSQVREHRSRWRARTPDSIISSLEELQPGDAVVHDSYGIGRFQGLKSLKINGHTSEFLAIKYAGTDTLYVPVYSLDLINRYVAGDTEDIPLHSLSSKKWANAKRKAKEQAFDVAAELIETQSLRDSFESVPCAVADSDYSEFNTRFPHELTVDQDAAVKAVLSDLRSTRPMDRLVCGDVGFGKTEVAIRAAFVCVSSGRQVAVVTPTTLLAQQHFDVFSERFAECSVAIELLSRLRAKSSAADAVQGLRNGKVDIVIGTHRLLQQDIRFKNLGLVVIDEEHRFGVRHKEYLKKLRAGVDVLTLTATPIPRTLSMALNAIRDISIVATPPDSRLSVRTFLRQWSAGLIREACMRELGRGGQIFYLHNDVKSIRAAAKELERIVPEARIDIAHGQMRKRELSSVMRDFYMQKFDILVCSTIIESGIDIPTANTILINNATRFGLAQLHQLRGRVGRSHHQAYAYLLVNDFAGLKNNSRLRLEAIESFDQLGIGFVIASHDLEIRGAGTLLGDSQSGAMHDVGFSLYSEYLNEAVESLQKSGRTATTAISTTVASEVSLNASALFPEDWIYDVNLRLSIYKRLAAASSITEIEDLESELRDRFGKPPETAKRLFEVAKIKQRSARLGIRKLTIGEKNGSIRFEPNANINAAGLVELLDSYPGEIRLNEAESSIILKHDLKTIEQRATSVHRVLDAITPNSDTL